ncbi:LacI family DNA-binding transcriptional regulator [Muricomes intestini]|uniref:LacI family DNA-binding transcriptional regulator n=1 Tax=Muricomes intestini TaxID=1796634 RepID=UPI002FE3976F
MTSIRDVAKKANVGSSTVSRVLNNSGYVSEEARNRIEEAMKELDYTPNELARHLFHKKTGIIAVLVPTVAHPFFAEFVDKTEVELYKKGYKTMLCNTAKEGNAEYEYLDMLNRHIVDGVISGVHSLDVEEYQKIKKPIVALDRYLGKNIPVVTVDHVRGGRMAAEELVKNGCKKVLHFRGSLAVESPYHDRHYEFDRVMKANSVEVYSYEQEWNRFDNEFFATVIEDIFSKDISFDGVFGVDLLCIGYMNEAMRRGIRVPEDVKIVSYDGTYVTRMTEPKVTAIVQPIQELASVAVHLIDELINGKPYQDKKVMLDVKMQTGGTTFH